MAANLDRAETSLTAVSDIAYIRGIDGSGNSVRISKADLANVLGAISGAFWPKSALKVKWNSQSLREGIYSTDYEGSDIDQPDLPSEVTDPKSCLFIKFRADKYNNNFSMIFLMYAPSSGERALYVNYFRSSFSTWHKIQTT